MRNTSYFILVYFYYCLTILKSSKFIHQIPNIHPLSNHSHSNSIQYLSHGRILLQRLQTLLQRLYPIRDLSSLVLHLLWLAQTVEDCLSVQLVEQDHLESVLGLFDQKETDDLGHAVVQHLHHDAEVTVESLADLLYE